jgi:thymidine phosphorylase
MKTPEQARSLARRLVATTRALGARASAFVTDMGWPIGRAVGNALEVSEAWDVLRGAAIPGTRALTLTLAAEMVHLAGAAGSVADARARVEKALDGDAALERFRALVRAQGGDLAALEAGRPLHAAAAHAEVPASRDGVLTGCDGFALGELIVALGGGRRRQEDTIDPSVGLELLCDRGARVTRGQAIARLHLARENADAVRRASACFEIADLAAELPPADLVLERVD